MGAVSRAERVRTRDIGDFHAKDVLCSRSFLGCISRGGRSIEAVELRGADFGSLSRFFPAKGRYWRRATARFYVISLSRDTCLKDMLHLPPSTSQRKLFRELIQLPKELIICARDISYARFRTGNLRVHFSDDSRCFDSEIGRTW